MYSDNEPLERTNFINLEIYKRNVSSTPLQPYLNIKPVCTRNTIFPMLDFRKGSNVSMLQRPTFDIEKTFNPSDRKAPNFSSYINTESELRNQIFAIQKNPQSYYVPNENSDLYFYRFETNKENLNQPHKYLFVNEKFENFNPNPDNLCWRVFNNPSRQDLKNS